VCSCRSLNAHENEDEARACQAKQNRCILKIHDCIEDFDDVENYAVLARLFFHVVGTGSLTRTFASLRLKSRLLNFSVL
jgi:hypothetical protein